MDGLCCLLSYPCRKVKLTATADQHGLLELDRSQLVQTELLNTGNFDDSQYKSLIKITKGMHYLEQKCYVHCDLAAVVTCRIRHIPEELFYIAAKTLSELVTEEDLAVGLVYPSIERIRDVSRTIAVKLAEYAYAHNLAALYPKPDNLDEFIKLNQYTAQYQDILPATWQWPTLN
ncbi:unnamed protein product [Rotaria sp. Silwood1]|nr:unnamed protein product [Rotaria sp. Silwood1]